MKHLRAFVYTLLAGSLALTVITTPVSADTAVDTNVSAAVASPAAGITTGEADYLQFMREEEKLARDVYLTLNGQWDLVIFQNIAESEQTHMDALKTLLDRYGIEDPVAGNEIGVFTNPELQELYDLLVQTGSESLADALKVGGAIEEIDILDLEERLAETDKADIVQVYENLLKGSRNHLRSFASTLEAQTGEVYELQYMTQDAYDAIIDSPAETGGNTNGRQGGNGPGR